MALGGPVWTLAGLVSLLVRSGSRFLVVVERSSAVGLVSRLWGVVVLLAAVLASGSPSASGRWRGCFGLAWCGLLVQA